jgi:hypothetical protein
MESTIRSSPGHEERMEREAGWQEREGVSARWLDKD